MSNVTKTTLIIGAAALIFGATVSANPTFAKGGDRTRVECKTESQTEDASMDARFESRNGRTKFDASYEAADGDVGAELPVLVNGINIGTMVLDLAANGDLVGDMSFDSQPDENEPFPGNFPIGVGSGSTVKVGVLECSLRS